MAATPLSHPEWVRRMRAVDRFSFHVMPLAMAHHHDATLKVRIGNRVDMQADDLPVLPFDSQRLRQLDVFPSARQRERPRHWLLDGARLTEQPR
jgi:hypothetical protein